MSDDMSDDEYRGRRQARMKITAWIVIIALVLVGGGATALSLLFN